MYMYTYIYIYIYREREREHIYLKTEKMRLDSLIILRIEWNSYVFALRGKQWKYWGIKLYNLYMYIYIYKQKYLKSENAPWFTDYLACWMKFIRVCFDG